MKYKSLIDQMSLRDKVALCSGEDFFATKAFEKYGIPSIRMADGPHGLRKQVESADHLGLNKSVPATCFPTASLIACSWDRDLLYEMGAAIAEEALQEGVSIVLGPGVNIKRNPLCGRNFEYFSEDPYLAGEMAAGWIEGLQSRGVGASLKHFAANNQENDRMSSDSLVDERTLREIYLPAFEKAIKQARPATVMCAYNKLNGTYCSDNLELLRDILRKEWGYQGIVVTDWGAANDRVKGFAASLDLEMPGSRGCFDEEVIAAIRNGSLPEERLNESVGRLLDLIFTAAENCQVGYRYDADAHHRLAKKIAVNSTVLLKNEDQILPIPQGKTIALIGTLAKEPRYQGAGSSHINPTRLSNAIEGFETIGYATTYFPGYPLNGSLDVTLIEEAASGAKNADVAVIFAGLPEAYESEGFDRESLAMPESHNALIARVAKANPNTVVALVGGAPVEMPWLPKVKAVLNLYLAGQAGGLAAAELLAGIANPSGKLAESYPFCYDDVPSAGCYEVGGKQAQYREGLYVGYRYFDTARQDVLFPFGHGLSYTNFTYQNLAVSHAELDVPYKMDLSLEVTNTGPVEGAEVVQVYVRSVQPVVFRPEKELKAFAKVLLKPEETRQVTFSLDARAFAIYDPVQCDWVVPDGMYQILAGASSRDIRLQAEVRVHGQLAPRAARSMPRWYVKPNGKPPQVDFEALLGRRITPVKALRKGEYTLECTFQDMAEGSFLIRQMIKGIERAIGKGVGGVDYTNPTFRLMMAGATGTPLKNLSLVSPGSMPRHITIGLVHLANGRILAGVLSILRKSKSSSS